MSRSQLMSKIEEILEYWIGLPDIDPQNWCEKTKLWYASNPQLDERIRERFGTELCAAEQGHRDTWRQSAKGSLALLILYDQFSRNLYRGTAAVYRNDAKAVSIANQLVDSHAFANLSIPAKLLTFHPYHHSEDMSHQERALDLARDLLKTSDAKWHEVIRGNLTYMENHAEVIRRFGRFPHRNDLLGRCSTPKEIEHMQKDGRTFGQ